MTNAKNNYRANAVRLAALPCLKILTVSMMAMAGMSLGMAHAQTKSSAKPATQLASLANESPRFSFSVSDASAANVFAMLGTMGAYNVIVPAGLEGVVTMTLKDVTMEDAMQSLKDAYGFDYKIHGKRVVVLPNALSTRVFKINYLTGQRQGASQVRVQSGSIGQAGSQGAASNAAGAQNMPSGNDQQRTDSSRVNTNSDVDFWSDAKTTLSAMISGEGRSVVLNPNAGVLVVKAYPKEIALVEEYLKAVQVSVQRQVMIEAKIVEVSLSDGSQSGVNWSIFGTRGKTSVTSGVVSPGSVLGNLGQISDGNVTLGQVASTGLASLTAKALGTGFYGLAFQGANFAAVLNFLKTQGGVQVLSSPRIATLNNQKALLKVGNDEFFVTNVSTNTTTSGTSAVTSPSITLTPFFSGISLDVTPQIDDDGVITMHVHPSISEVREKQKLVDLGSLGQFQIPSASSSVNETDSIVRIKNGQIAAIGGLMSSTSRSDRSGVPGLSEAPVVGGLFGQRSTSSTKHELVILIKPTLIDENEVQEIQEVTMGNLELTGQTQAKK